MTGKPDTNGAVMPTALTGVAPPHSIEAEEAVLGAALLYPNCLRPLLVDGLLAAHFFRDRHRAIFAAMCAMDAVGEGIDPLTVAAHLRVAGTLEDVGGVAALDALTGGVPGLGNVRQYATIIRQHAVRRGQLDSVYGQLAGIVNCDDAAYQDALMQAHTLGRSQVMESFAKPDALGSHMFEYLAQEPSEGFPLPPDLSSLRKFMRCRRGHSTIVYAWSHMGKSHLVAQVCDTVGRAGFKAIMWTNEDNVIDNTARQVQRMTGVPALSIIERRVHPDHLPKVARALGELPFGIVPCAGMNARELAADIRYEAPDVAVVDYLHRVDGLERTSDIDAAMLALTNVPKFMDLHLFVVAQLNHERNKSICRPPPVPRDILGSGRIYDMADNAISVHRTEEESDDEAGRITGQATTLDEGHIAVSKSKGMSSELGQFPVQFDRTRARFVEKAPVKYANDPDAWLR